MEFSVYVIDLREISRAPLSTISSASIWSAALPIRVWHATATSSSIVFGNERALFEADFVATGTLRAYRFRKRQLPPASRRRCIKDQSYFLFTVTQRELARYALSARRDEQDQRCVERRVRWASPTPTSRRVRNMLRPGCHYADFVSRVAQDAAIRPAALSMRTAKPWLRMMAFTASPLDSGAASVFATGQPMFVRSIDAVERRCDRRATRPPQCSRAYARASVWFITKSRQATRCPSK